MNKVYYDDIFSFNEYELEQGEEVFGRILKERERMMDTKRFFLNFISKEELMKYDFNDKKSLNEFRELCLTFKSPIRKMGGCNLRFDICDEYKNDIRYAGIKLSDPMGLIPGQFDMRNNVLTYSPIFPFFYIERDLIKFANDSYFTAMTFEEIIMNMINSASKYYVHTDDYYRPKDLVKYGNYVLEEISKDEMIEFATNGQLGEKILKRYLK